MLALTRSEINNFQENFVVVMYQYWRWRDDGDDDDMDEWHPKKCSYNNNEGGDSIT